MNSLYTCSYRCRDFAGNNVLPMILSASAFNSCMIEFSIPDFNETIISNIISLFLSLSNTGRREVVFCTQWFIGQCCSKRGERVPLSLYISRTRRERTFVAVLHFHYMTLYSTDAKVNFSGKSTRFRSNVEPIQTRYPAGERERKRESSLLFLLDQRAPSPLVPSTYRSSLAHATGDG